MNKKGLQKPQILKKNSRSSYTGVAYKYLIEGSDKDDYVMLLRVGHQEKN